MARNNVPYLNKDEQMLNRPFAVFRSYWSRSIVFDDSQTKAMLKEAGELEFFMDEAMLRRIIMGYGDKPAKHQIDMVTS